MKPTYTITMDNFELAKLLMEIADYYEVPEYAKHDGYIDVSPDMLFTDTRGQALRFFIDDIESTARACKGRIGTDYAWDFSMWRKIADAMRRAADAIDNAWGGD